MTDLERIAALESRIDDLEELVAMLCIGHVEGDSLALGRAGGSTKAIISSVKTAIDSGEFTEADGLYGMRLRILL